MAFYSNLKSVIFKNFSTVPNHGGHRWEGGECVWVKGSGVEGEGRCKSPGFDLSELGNYELLYTLFYL